MERWQAARLIERRVRAQNDERSSVGLSTAIARAGQSTSDDAETELDDWNGQEIDTPQDIDLLSSSEDDDSVQSESQAASDGPEYAIQVMVEEDSDLLGDSTSNSDTSSSVLASDDGREGTASHASDDIYDAVVQAQDREQGDDAFRPFIDYVRDCVENEDSIDDLDRTLLRFVTWKINHYIGDNGFAACPTVKDGMLSRRSAEGARSRIQVLSGLRHKQIPCCVNFCQAFDVDSPTVPDRCPHCNETLWLRRGGVNISPKTPRQTYWYLPITPRLIAGFAVHAVAAPRRHYMDQVWEHLQRTRAHGYAPGTDDELSDFFTSEMFSSFHQLFDRNTMALSSSTDGVSIIRQGTTRGRPSQVWPCLVTALSDPPELRARNLLPTFVIPASNPVDLASFFWPLLEELEVLGGPDGVPAWDVTTNTEFRLRAQLVLCTGDMPAQAKLMKMRGHNSKCPCRYCEITGVRHPHNRHLYYPNCDAPPSADLNQADATLELRDDPIREGLRDTIIWACAQPVAIRNAAGINGLSLMLNVESLWWPWSFGLDIMHLFSNCAKQLWMTWCGDFLPDIVLEENTSSSNSSSSSSSAEPPEYIDFVLTQSQRDSIGDAMFRSVATSPWSVTRSPRSIEVNAGSFKAVEWISGWVLQYSLPLLWASRCHPEVLANWALFVHGVRLAMCTSISREELAEMERCFRAFVIGFERIYSLPRRQASSRLRACSTQIHHLLHVAQAIRAVGPSFVQWQFTIEKYFSTLEAPSKKHVNTSMTKRIEAREMLHWASLLHNSSQGVWAGAGNRLVLPEDLMRSSPHLRTQLRTIHDGGVVGRNYGCVSLAHRQQPISARVRSALVAAVESLLGEGTFEHELVLCKTLSMYVPTGTAHVFEVAADTERQRRNIALSSRTRPRGGQQRGPDRPSGRDAERVRHFVQWDTLGRGSGFQCGRVAGIYLARPATRQSSIADDAHTDPRQEDICLVVAKPFVTAQVAVSDLRMEQDLGVGERLLDDPLGVYEDLPLVVMSADQIERPLGLLDVSSFGRELEYGPHARRRPHNFVLRPERIEGLL